MGTGLKGNSEDYGGPGRILPFLLRTDYADIRETGGSVVPYEEEKEDTTIYKVVINHEEQYSIWFADRETPAGWREVGKSGPKADCLAYIKEHWTDMRPLSVRRRMEERESHAGG
jgi:MbtH protein